MQPYPGTADLCPGGPCTSPQLVGITSKMNSRNLKQHNNQQRNPNTFNNSAPGPGHYKSSRHMLDEFETGQRMERQQTHFPQQQRAQHQERFLDPREAAFHQSHGNNYIPERQLQFTNRQPNEDRRLYNCSPETARGFHEEQRNSQQDFRRRYNNSPEQLPQLSKERQYNRSPARVPPTRSPPRVSMDKEPREPGGTSGPKVNYNLCGSRQKWYVRYLKQGFSRDEAMLMAREPTQPAANYKQSSNPAIKRHGPDMVKRRSPVVKKHSPEVKRPSPQVKRPTSGVKRPSPQVKRRSPEVKRPSPEAKRRRQSWDEERPSTSREPEMDEERIKICLMPRGYPEQKLTQLETLDLEEAITIEVSTSRLECPLRFSSVVFRSGYLEVECFDKFSADWLMRNGWQLPSYSGHPVDTELKLKPKQICITLYLPHSAGKSDNFLVQLLRSQNAHDIGLWTLVSREDDESGAHVVFSIDENSASNIAMNGHKLFYRMSTIDVHGLERHGNKEKPSNPLPTSRSALRSGSVAHNKYDDY